MINIERIYGLSIDLDDLKELRKTKIEFKQYDYKTSYIALKFYKGDTFIENIGENYIIGVFRDSEGSLYVDSNGLPIKTYAFNYEEENGIVILPISKEVINTTGNVACEMIIINKKGLRVTSPRFNFTIHPSLLDYQPEEPIETICGTFRSGESICGYGNAEKIDIKKYITYEKTVWVDGETVVNQERLNNIENGIYNVSEHLNTVENSLNDNQERFSNIENNINDMSENLNDIEKGFNDISDSFVNNQERLDTVENSLNNISENLNNIENNINDNQERLDDMSDSLNTVENSLNDISENLNNIDANSIKYETSADETITTIQDALDKLLYVPLTINLSCNRSIAEKGENITTLTFNWNYNKNVVNQTFEGESLDKNLRTYKYDKPVSTNKTFTLIANDGKNTVSKSTSISFRSGRYWGVSSLEEYDSNFIKTLSKELNESRAKTFTVDCGNNQHIFYCIPSRLGTPVFTVGGFSGGFYKVNTIQFSNDFGYVESYDIWKSTNNNLGNTTVVVS